MGPVHSPGHSTFPFLSRALDWGQGRRHFSLGLAQGRGLQAAGGLGKGPEAVGLGMEALVLWAGSVRWRAAQEPWGGRGVGGVSVRW